jgi:hypothetical protein
MYFFEHFLYLYYSDNVYYYKKHIKMKYICIQNSYLHLVLMNQQVNYFLFGVMS